MIMPVYCSNKCADFEKLRMESFGMVNNTLWSFYFKYCHYALPVWTDLLFTAAFTCVSVSFSMDAPFGTKFFVLLEDFVVLSFDGLPLFRFSAFFVVELEEDEDIVFFFFGVLTLLLGVLFITSEFRGFDRISFRGFDVDNTFSNSFGFSNNSWWYFNSSTALFNPAVFFIWKEKMDN